MKEVIRNNSTKYCKIRQIK